MGHGYTGQCEVCDARDPMWTIVRRGDVAMSWACPEHLSQVCDGLQRDHEVTRLDVINHHKAAEWAEIGKMLRKVGDGA